MRRTASEVIRTLEMRVARLERQASHRGYYEIGRVEPKKSDFWEALKLVSEMETLVKNVEQVKEIWNTLTMEEKKSHTAEMTSIYKLRNEIEVIVLTKLVYPFDETWYEEITPLITGLNLQDPKGKLKTLKALSNFKSEIRKQMSIR